MGQDIQPVIVYEKNITYGTVFRKRACARYCTILNYSSATCDCDRPDELLIRKTRKLLNLDLTRLLPNKCE